MVFLVFRTVVITKPKKNIPEDEDDHYSETEDPDHEAQFKKMCKGQLYCVYFIKYDVNYLCGLVCDIFLSLLTVCRGLISFAPVTYIVQVRLQI